MPRSLFKSKRELLCFGLLCGVLFCACYQSPDDLVDEDVIAVTIKARHQPALADGRGMADVVLHLDPSTSIAKEFELQISSGVINFSSAKPEEGRTIRLKVPLDGEVSLPLRYGREVGALHVEARVDDFVAFGELELGRNPADVVRVDVDPLIVDADGRATFDATIELARGDDTEVSIGQLVELRACCASKDGKPVECAQRPPFRLPPLVALTEGEHITLPVVAERMTAKTSSEIRAFVVAAPVSDKAASDNTLRCNDSGSAQADLFLQTVVVK